mgnify:CR=1 FL=1
MKRITLTLIAVVLSLSALYSQTVNYSSIKVKTSTTSREYPYDQFVMLNYGYVNLKRDFPSGNVLGIQYGQVHIGGWYVSADFSLSSLHFSHSDNAKAYYDSYYKKVYGFDGSSEVVGKPSFNRMSFGAGGIVRMVIPLYLYLGFGYCYQNVTVQTEKYGWIEMADNIFMSKDQRISPHSSGYFELGLQGNIKGFTLRTGYRYNFHENHEFSVGIGWTFGRKSKNTEAKKQ